MSTLDLALSPAGALALGPDGDLVSFEGDAAVRARVLRAFVTTPGDLPYSPDTGAGAPSHEGGPPVAGDELARAVLVEARRDPDVLDASSAQVSRSATGVTIVSCRIRTRLSPDAASTLALRLP